MTVDLYPIVQFSYQGQTRPSSPLEFIKAALENLEIDEELTIQYEPKNEEIDGKLLVGHVTLSHNENGEELNFKVWHTPSDNIPNFTLSSEQDNSQFDIDLYGDLAITRNGIFRELAISMAKALKPDIINSFFSENESASSSKEDLVKALHGSPLVAVRNTQELDDCRMEPCASIIDDGLTLVELSTTPFAGSQLDQSLYQRIQNGLTKFIEQHLTI